MPFVAIGALIGGAAAAAGVVGGTVLAAAAIGGGIGLGAQGLVDSMTPEVSTPKQVLQFKADPHAGIPYMIGRAATGGNLIAQLVSNDTTHKWLHNFVVLSLGPIAALSGTGTSFHLGPDAVSFSSNAATGKYASNLWMTTTTGPTSGWSLAQPSGTGTVPDWGVNHLCTGYSMARLVLKHNTQLFANGSFETPRWVGKWVLVYDPRKDSTRTDIGGSGSHRIDNEATWEWSDNPYLHALTWIVGRRRNGFLLAGVGCPPELIDVAAFANGANVAEANGWTCGGGVSTTDDPYQVLGSMLQAGGGQPVPIGGRISCLVNEPKTSVATVTEADLDGPCAAAKRARRRDRFNHVVAQYVSEAHDWETVPADAYSVSAYVSADGRRSREIVYPLVQNATQATQLGAYAIYNSYERQPITLSVRLGFARLGPGDVFTAELPTLGIEADLLVLRKRLNPRTLAVELECRIETAGKHEDALGLTGEALDPPAPIRPDPTDIPAPTDWTATTGTLSAGGIDLPTVVISGPAQLDPMVIEYKRSADSVWQPLYEIQPGTTKADLGVTAPGTNYDVRLAFKIRGVVGAWLTLSTTPSGAFDPGVEGGGGSNIVTSYFQDEEPTGDLNIGDLWFDTDDGLAPYQWDGDSWEGASGNAIAIAILAALQALADAAAAEALADNKVKWFFLGTEPTATGVGDVWVNTSLGNRTFRWTGSAWVEFAREPVTNLTAPEIVGASVSALGSVAKITATVDIPTTYESTPGKALAFRWRKESGDPWTPIPAILGIATGDTATGAFDTPRQGNISVQAQYWLPTGDRSSWSDSFTVDTGTTPEPVVSERVYRSDDPGAWSWRATFDGNAKVRLWGGGGTPGDPFIAEGKEETIVPPGPASSGAYSEEVIAVVKDVTVLSGTVGAGGLVSIDGGATTCAQTGQTAGGGEHGSADEGGSIPANPATASGGTTNISGNVSGDGSGAGAPNGGDDAPFQSGLGGANGTAPGGAGAVGDTTEAYLGSGLGENGRVDIERVED